MPQASLIPRLRNSTPPLSSHSIGWNKPHNQTQNQDVENILLPFYEKSRKVWGKGYRYKEEWEVGGINDISHTKMYSKSVTLSTM